MGKKKNSEDGHSQDPSVSDSSSALRGQISSLSREHDELLREKAEEAADALAGFRASDAEEDRQLAERDAAIEAGETSLEEVREMMSAVLADCREIPKLKRRLEDNLPLRYKERLHSKIGNLNHQRQRCRVRLVDMIEAEAGERSDGLGSLRYIEKELRYWTLHWGDEGVADDLIKSLAGLRDEAEREGDDTAEERADKLAQLAGLSSVPWSKSRLLLEFIFRVMYDEGDIQGEGESEDALRLDDFVERVRPFFIDADTGRHYENDLEERVRSQPVRWAESSTKLAVYFDILYKTGVATVQSPPGFTDFAERLLPAFVSSKTGLEFDKDADIQKHYWKPTAYRDRAMSRIEKMEELLGLDS